MTEDTRRIVIEGTAVPVRGDDIDTDRIIPARYLRTVTFTGLGEHAFEDDRAELARAGQKHSFDDPRFAGARILIANKNFGCGSSREHAPQALMRWGQGISVVIAESFAEIFNSNCFSIGIPCVKVDEANAQALMSAIEANPRLAIRINFEQCTIEAGDRKIEFEMPAGIRQRFLEGSWDSATELLSNRGKIAETAKNLPYMSAFGARA
ncbi:MAG TPA: 3-isopropylmalate dehydratase small subunit [Polyangiaceae bacterium]|nr:3-isopropylmalate dehydratase small subunit [Polyangiaceae bacterium]